MNHNNQKKIAVINDISGFGRCSVAVSLPVISYLGIQCCPVPTSIFSNHTGFPHYQRFQGRKYKGSGRPCDGRKRKGISHIYKRDVSGDKKAGRACRYYYAKCDGGMYFDRY